MNIDVSRIVSAEGAVVPVSGTVAPENLMFNGQDIRFTAPVTVEGKLPLQLVRRFRPQQKAKALC